eukprot:6188114-Pleurochrysis_carterae.AAC.2
MSRVPTHQSVAENEGEQPQGQPALEIRCIHEQPRASARLRRWSTVKSIPPSPSIRALMMGCSELYSTGRMDKF